MRYCAKMQHSMRNVDVSTENGMQIEWEGDRVSCLLIQFHRKTLSLLIKISLDNFICQWDEASPFFYWVSIAEFSRIHTFVHKILCFSIAVCWFTKYKLREYTNTHQWFLLCIFHRQHGCSPTNDDAIYRIRYTQCIRPLNENIYPCLCLMCTACICIVGRCVAKRTHIPYVRTHDKTV